MAERTKCTRCKGKGYHEVLISQHGDETEIVKCQKCNGKGEIYIMSNKDEQNYWEDYW